MKMPTPTEIAAIAGAVGMMAQYFGVVVPTNTTSAANRDANFTARDALAQCHEERDKLLDKLLEMR